MQTCTLVWGSVLRCSIRPLFHQFQGNGARRYPKAHLSLNIYHVSDLTGRDSWDVAAPPGAWNSTPCNRSLKMWLSFSASGIWLINYMLAVALWANLCTLFHKFIPTLFYQCGTLMYCRYLTDSIRDVAKTQRGHREPTFFSKCLPNTVCVSVALLIQIRELMGNSQCKHIWGKEHYEERNN